MYLLFTDTLIRTIGWTLLHSLWMGLALAILGGMLMLLTRRSDATVRYNLLCALMSLFIIAVIVAFYMLWQQGPVKSSIGNPAEEPDAALQLPLMQSIVGMLDNNAVWIVRAWSLLVTIKLLKLITDFFYVSRIKRLAVYLPGENWERQLSILAERVGVHRKVRLLESALVKVPVVAGHFKPLILVPLGILSNLPASEIEAVLLHELAHVRRNDFLVNLIQRVAELIFFFNPGLLWISSLIREERENCCDDSAINISRNKAGYVQALVSFREYALKQQPVAVALFGRRHQLLARLSRIVHSRNKTLSIRESGFVILNVVLLVALLVVTGKPTVFNKVREVELAATNSKMVPVMSPAGFLTETAGSIKNNYNQVNDHLEESAEEDAADHEGNEQSREALEKLKQASADRMITDAGNRNADADRSNADADRNNADADRSNADQSKINADRSNGDRSKANADGRKINIDGRKAAAEELKADVNERKADADRRENNVNRSKAEAARKRTNPDTESAEINRARAEESRRRAVMDQMQASNDRVLAAKDRQQAQLDRMQADKDREQADKDRGQADKDREQADKDRAQAELDRKQAEKDRTAAEYSRSQAAKDRLKAVHDKSQEEKARRLVENDFRHSANN